MDPPAFISRLIGATARLGAIVAIVGAAVYFGRRAGIVFFTDLNEGIYQTIIIAGLIGAATVAVELTLVIGRMLKWLGSKIANNSRHAEQRRMRDNALKNMESLTLEYAQVLRFLKSRDRKRFIASPESTLLYSMERAGLLGTDDTNWSVSTLQIYYQVPDYVWNDIDKVLEHFPVPPSEPWLRQP